RQSPYQRVRLANNRYACQILSPLKEKDGSSDRAEFRPDVILSLRFKKGRRNAEIVILRLEFRGHLQRLLSVVEVSRCRRASASKCGAVGVSCFTRWIIPNIANCEFEFAQSCKPTVGRPTDLY